MFTKKADYALLALSFLATDGLGRIVGPREIARHYDIPAELLAKIMQTLARRQVVMSVPGPTGGYKLVRQPQEISVGEILEAVDGPLAIAQCWESDGVSGCQQAQHCHLRGPLAEIQDEVARLLKRMTLQDVCCRPAESAGEKAAHLPRRAYEASRTLTMWESPLAVSGSDAVKTAN